MSTSDALKSALIFLTFLALLAYLVFAELYAPIYGRDGPHGEAASGAGPARYTPQADRTQATARHTRVPCWAPPSQRTCTPTPTQGETGTPTPPELTQVPTSTDTPRPIPSTSTPVPPTSTATTVPTETPTTASTATTAATPTTTPTATPDYRNPPPNILAAEEEMRTLINNHRASRGQQTFLHFVELDRAQRRWAVEMVVTNQCYHGDFGQRAAQEGYTGFAWGEAGSCGYPNAGAAFQGWLDSPGHRGIVEAVTMTEFGVGAQTYPNGNFQFWLAVGCDAQIPCTGSLEMEPRLAPVPPIIAGPEYGSGLPPP